MMTNQRLFPFVALMRLDKPIGIWLLLWPTLWALWLASAGHPHRTVFIVFVLGVMIMRAAGCIMNDIADRHIDGRVARTRNRPLAIGSVSVKQALGLCLLLLAMAFVLVLFCNWLTIQLALIGAALALFYPFLKRVTHLPQLGLGAAFMWGIPMAFAAETGTVDANAWFLYAAAIVWPMIYDTMYAMVDRQDDVVIGVKSTAILFGQYDVAMIALLQAVFIGMMVWVGKLFQLSFFYDIGLIFASLLFLYQQWLLQAREPQRYFQAFLNNHWVGVSIFLGIFLSYLA